MRHMDTVCVVDPKLLCQPDLLHEATQSQVPGDAQPMLTLQVPSSLLPHLAAGHFELGGTLRHHDPATLHCHQMRTTPKTAGFLANVLSCFNTRLLGPSPPRLGSCASFPTQ